MAIIAGQLAVTVGGLRPTDILGINDSPYEDLMLDVAIVGKVLPKSADSGSSLADELRERRRMSEYNYKLQRWLHGRS